MSADPFRHSLVHVFLEEELGGNEPPDLSRSILSRAFGGPDTAAGTLRGVGVRPGRGVRLRRLAPAAAAAAALIAVGVWLLTASGGYPAPSISGDYQLTSGDTLERGAGIRTEEGSALLHLGGYCRIEIAPWTTLGLGGGDYGEELRLETGIVTCGVDSKVGRFAVLTELGSARVSGTKFTVSVGDFGGLRRMRVKVIEGAVEVSDGSVGGVLRAGRERTIFGDEVRQPDTAPDTKPDEKTSGEIEPVAPSAGSEFSSSSDEGFDELGLKIRAVEDRIAEIEPEIRRLREENRMMLKELEDRRDFPEGDELEQLEREIEELENLE